MRKLLIIYLILCLTALVFGQGQSGVKPMLGRQINKAHQLGDPIGAWLFNEGSGNKVFDLSGNGNNGAITGATWVPGKFGSALDFADDYVITTDTNPGDYPNGTIVVWVKLDSLTNSNRIWSCFNGGAEFELLIYNSTFDFYKTGGSAWDIYGGLTLSTGIWYQVVCTWSNGNFARLYVNGILDGEDLTASVEDHVSLEFGRKIGSTSGEDMLDGQIDHALYYGRALSASEVALLYPEPFCMFERDDVALMAVAAAPPPSGGQVITIQMSMIPLFLIFTLVCFIRRKES